jgi:hypothetical protein
METPVKFEWCPSGSMIFFMLTLTLWMWKKSWDLCYLHRDILDWLAFPILAIAPFLYLFIVWGFFEWIFEKIYGKV